MRLFSRYVGNLHPFVTENMLQEVFTYAGMLEQVKIVRVSVQAVDSRRCSRRPSTDWVPLSRV